MFPVLLVFVKNYIYISIDLTIRQISWSILHLSWFLLSFSSARHNQAEQNQIKPTTSHAHQTKDDEQLHAKKRLKRNIPPKPIPSTRRKLPRRLQPRILPLPILQPLQCPIQHLGQSTIWNSTSSNSARNGTSPICICRAHNSLNVYE